MPALAIGYASFVFLFSYSIPRSTAPLFQHSSAFQQDTPDIVLTLLLRVSARQQEEHISKIDVAIPVFNL